MVAETRKLQRSEVESLVREVLTQKLRGTITPPPSVGRSHTSSSRAGGPPNPLVVNVSARHMHVTPKDLEALFGPGAKLTKLKDLYQQGEFASEQLVTIVGPRQPPCDLATNGIAVEIGAVEKGGRGLIGHENSPLSENCRQDSGFPAVPRGGRVNR